MYFIPQGTPGMPKNFRNTTRYQHGKRRFEYADLNKDGHLTIHEFIYFLNPEEGKHMRKCITLVSLLNIYFLFGYIYVEETYLNF